MIRAAHAEGDQIRWQRQAAALVPTTRPAVEEGGGVTAGDTTPAGGPRAGPVKPALRPLRRAEAPAELVGAALSAGEQDVPAAGLIRAAGEAVEDLDTWAI